MNLQLLAHTARRIQMPLDGHHWAQVQMQRVSRNQIAWQLTEGTGLTVARSPMGISSFGWDWPNRWAQYTVLILGLVPSPETQPDPSWFALSIEGQTEQLVRVKPFLQAAFHTDSQAYGEITWHPDIETHAVIRLPDVEKATMDDLARIIHEGVEERDGL
ncbi:hypothetical protein BH23CHL4_BH23CHL4_29000 [soil metagenome]